jgi:hypothetical protein
MLGFISEATMFSFEVGQELEFIQPAHVDGQLIAKGTRVRVGALMSELLDSNVTLIVHGGKPAQTLTVPRHVVSLHCRPAA